MKTAETAAAQEDSSETGYVPIALSSSHRWLSNSAV
jgi:hypothetical protein